MLRGIASAVLFCWASVVWGGPPPDGPVPESGKVIKVYDGDTITLESGDKVRVRWINTPELRPLEPFAVEARDAANKLVMGQDVKLVYGPGGKRDGYGRLVAGVVAGDTELSLLLLSQGLAHVFIIPPDDRDPTDLLAAQEKARVAGLGVWSLPEFRGDLHISSFHANGRGDDNQNPNSEYLRVCNITNGPLDLSNYTIENIEGRQFPLPSIQLPPGNTVQIHSGKGTDQKDPQQQIKVYLGADTELYDNKRDRATIRTKGGAVVTEREHQTK